MSCVPNSYSSPSRDRLYPITVNIQNAFGGFTPVTALSDSVTGDTRIYWKIGENLKFGTMEDLYCSYISSNEKRSYKILSARRNPKSRNPPYQEPKMNANNIEIIFSDIKDVVYHGIKPVFKVTLRNGKTIKITKDHSVFCGKSPNTGMVAKTLDELDNVVSVDNYGFNQEKPIPLNNDLLTFMGLWVADGSYQKDKGKLSGIRISTGGEKNILGWLQEFSEQYDNKILKPDGSGEILQNSKNGLTSCLKYSKSRFGDVYISRKILANQIYSIFGNVYSETKRVPKELFTATEEQICAFLRGYFSGDGSVHICNDNPNNKAAKYGSYYCVDCCSINRELLEDISILLDILGIKHNISSPYKPGKKGYNSDKLQYKLIIHVSHSVDKFMEKIGIIKAHTFKSRENYKREKRFRPVSLRDVRSIEYIGIEPVYDISVAETEAFVANGILCHNSGNEISIFKREVADQLGLDLNQGEMFKVSGINGQSREFRRFPLIVRIGNLDSMKVRLGFAVKHGDLAENLIGNTDIVKSGKIEVTYSKDQVTYRETFKSGVCNAGSGMDLFSEAAAFGGAAVTDEEPPHYQQEILNNLYEELIPKRHPDKINYGDWEVYY